VNADIAIALGSSPQDVQPALQALWALDDALGRVLATGREPMITRIRLAWWREGLERLDREPAPKEPVLEGVARELLPRGLTGAELGEMEAGWLAVVSDQPVTAAELDTYAAKRGGLLFALTARLLGEPEAEVRASGEAWALVDLARHSIERSDVEAALAAARARSLPRRWPRRLRPLGMLAVLAARDVARGPERWEEPDTPPRHARMLRHRLTGF
jgi:phytoene synthase